MLASAAPRTPVTGAGSGATRVQAPARSTSELAPNTPDTMNTCAAQLTRCGGGGRRSPCPPPAGSWHTRGPPARGSCWAGPPASRRCRTWTPSSWCSGPRSAQPCHRQRWRRRLCKHDEDTPDSLSRLWILLLDGIFQQEGVPLHGAAICEQVHGAGAAPAAQQQHAARHAPGGVARPLAAQLARPRPPPPRQHQAEPGAAGAAERPAVSRVQVPGTGHTSHVAAV